MAAPESVRDVVRHRLERLGPATARALEVAAVAGSEFELATLRAAAELSEGELLDAVDEAERHGLIGEIPSRGLAYRFSHELLRRAVIDRLSTARRAAIHLRVAEALARGDPGLPSRNLAALAHHYAAAAPVGGREPAVRYSLLAARAATAALAFDESAEQLRTALALGIPDPAQAADAYLELGYACHRAGKVLDALAAFRETVGLARQLDDPQLLARAAIGYEETCWRPAIHDGGSVALLEEAAAALGPEDSEVRTRLLGGLGRALAQLGDFPRGLAVGDESIAMARRRGDPRSLALTLAGSWGRSSNTSRKTNTMLQEALAISEELGDEGLRTEVIVWLIPSFVGVCEHAQARRYLAQLFAAGRRQNQPFHLHVAEHYDSALALCDGDLAHADAAATRSYEWSRLLTGRDASGSHGVQMFNIRREQGRLAELAPVIRLLAGKGQVAWRPGLAALLAELGMTREAKRELTRVVANLSGERRSIWLAALLYLTDCAVALNDESAAAAVYAELLQFEGRNSVIGHLVACLGASDRYLGMLATVLGEWELAEVYFEAAAALNQHLGARTWSAHTAYEHGRMLLRRGRGGDREAAAALMQQALGIAEPLGLSRVIAAVRATGAALAPTHVSDDGLSARERDVLRLVARGMSNREIGATLFISEHTTASHVRNILRKTGCANRTEAAAYAHRCGLVD
jgi:DNA-binding CsgD family transcriptional regulator